MDGSAKRGSEDRGESARAMTAIAVTGANGKTGRAVVTDLLQHGYDVIAVDNAGRPGDGGDLAPLNVSLLRADLTDYGQTIEALHGADAVVHLANIPAPGLFTPSHTFTANTAMNSNVFLAAAQLRLGRVVWASSETTLGLPFDTPPRYAPVDEDHYPLPTSTYSLSKVVGRRWPGTSAPGPAFRSSVCGCRMCTPPRSMPACRATGRTRTPAGGTCGGTSTCVTPRRRSGSACRPR